MKKLNVGVVGATGMVGTAFIQLLQERKFPVHSLRPFASDKSVGQSIELYSTKYKIESLKPDCFNGLDLVFFSSGDEISKQWAPEAVRAGAYAIDNSNAFRMDQNTHLIVPEVNRDLIKNSRAQIIANPNCTTIQLVVALNQVQKKYGISEIKLASYQAVSGAGQEAYAELLNQVSDQNPQAKVFPHPIAFNCIPQIGAFDDTGFCSEEQKVMNETKKILRLPSLKVSAFTVRVPVLNAHAVATWVSLQTEASKEALLQTLSATEGVVIEDDAKNSVYPQQYKASGKDAVYVGRVHKDPNDAKTWMMWIVADNIRKGAALNGIQIAEHIFNASK